MLILVRKAKVDDAEWIAKVRVDTWRTAYKGILTEEFLSNMSSDQSRHMWETILLDPKSQDAVYVAEDSSKHVVGFVSCGPYRDNDPLYKGEIYALYVLQEGQKRGIGRQLMQAAVTSLKNRGFNSMIAWVLADNPSSQFYERLGGKHVQTRNIAIGGKQLEEYAYGWKDLAMHG
jgi:L-amino acid N-acyltransferase YncA